MIKDDKKDTKDKELQEASVKFLPFVGDNYEHGISFDKDGNLVLGTEENQGKKVLVLGESHYCDGDCCDCGNFKLHKECAEFTRNVINEYLDESKERQNWMRTFLTFERALSNADPNIDSNSIWNHLIFYNYLQRPLRGTRMAGGSKDYENAATPFYAILKMFKPDCVIVWGRRLFANLPYKHGEEGEYMPSIDSCTWNYQIYGHTIKVLPIYHPSVGFSWDYWHEVIVDFLK